MHRGGARMMLAALQGCLCGALWKVLSTSVGFFDCVYSKSVYTRVGLIGNSEQVVAATLTFRLLPL